MDMRNLFPGYYRPTEAEFEELWKNCIFSFDTNILLNIYRYTTKTRERLFEIIDGLKERIWIPHQVAYEFHNNRLDVISNQSQPYDDIKKLLDDKINEIKKKLKEYEKRHSFVEFIDPKQIVETLEKTTQEIQKNLAKAKDEHPDFFKHDPFLEKISSLLESKVGKPYTEQELEEIYQISERRFTFKTPPGYKDIESKAIPERYGDVLLWFQLIDEVKSQNKPVIFVTDDDKEDWWFKHQKKTIGPRPELVEEMLLKANNTFYMYNSDQFMKYAANFLKLDEQPEAIEEAKEIRNSIINSDIIETAQSSISLNPRVMAALEKASLTSLNPSVMAALEKAVTIQEQRLAKFFNVISEQRLAKFFNTSPKQSLANLNTIPENEADE